MGMDGLKLWETIKVSLRYPYLQKNVTATTVGLKHCVDVNIVAGGGGGGGSSQTEIISGVDGPATLSNMGAGKIAVDVRVLELILSYIDDSVSIGSNGAIVSTANPFPVAIVSPPVISQVSATSTLKSADYTEPIDALSIAVICETGVLTLPGGRVLTAGESMSFSALTNYKLNAFAVTAVAGTFTINVVR